MFKFIVVCALIGAAVAEPDPAQISSYAFPGAVVAPASPYYPTVYNNYAYSSPYVQPSHFAYSAPLTHLIKKRSVFIAPPAVAATYATAPYAATYSAFSPLTTSYATTYPTAYGSPLYTTGAHFIKKRSAPLVVPSTYSYTVPTAYAASPLYTPRIAATSYISSPYVSSPYVSSPYVSTLPLAYTTPFIKK